MFILRKIVISFPVVDNISAIKSYFDKVKQNTLCFYCGPQYRHKSRAHNSTGYHIVCQFFFILTVLPILPGRSNGILRSFSPASFEVLVVSGSIDSIGSSMVSSILAWWVNSSLYRSYLTMSTWF